MSEWLSPSPYGWHDWDITPAGKQTLIYHQMHNRNNGTGSVIDTARRARDYQAKLAEIERIVDEYSHRYSEGSQGRVAIESVSLKINGG